MYMRGVFLKAIFFGLITILSISAMAQSEEESAVIQAIKSSAERGDAEAQFNLGVMYCQGEGVSQSDTKAYMWYNISFANGSSYGARNRDIIAKQMSRDDLAKAQQDAERCINSEYKDCD